MGIEDIQISEELETNAPSIKYRGNEGPKSPQEMEKMIMASLEEEYAKYVFEMQEQGLEPMSMQRFIEQAMAEGQMSGGQPLPNDPTKPVNPFQPKPTGPVLPDRQMAAYGGIMGMDGRKQYGIGSWFQEKIMDPIKENPLLAATAAYLGYDTYQNKSDLGESILGKGLGQITKERTRKDAKGEDETYTIGGDVAGLIGKNIIPIAGGIGAGLFTKNTESDTPGLPDDTTGIQLADLKKTANLLDQKQGMAAGLNFLPTVASRKYTPAEMIDVYQTAANGGRIGFDNGGGIMMASSDMGDPKENAEYYSQRMFGKPYKELNADELEEFQEEMRRLMNKFMSNSGRIDEQRNMAAYGGRMGYAFGTDSPENNAIQAASIEGLPLNQNPAGVTELDLRDSGGFIPPVGVKEKADDIPAMLANNEFVFTADAVRGMGDGNVNKGAQRMYDMMKKLEKGGRV